MPSAGNLMTAKLWIRNFKQTLVRWSELLGQQAYNFGGTIFQAAKDHSKLWTAGMTAVLKISSFFCLVPFTVTTHQSGLEIRVATRRHLFKTRICTVVGGLRLILFLSIALDENIQWLNSGLFTADAFFFVVWFLLASEAYAIHVVLLHQKEDFTFLCNATSKLNQAFSSMFREQVRHAAIVIITRLSWLHIVLNFRGSPGQRGCDACGQQQIHYYRLRCRWILVHDYSCSNGAHCAIFALVARHAAIPCVWEQIRADGNGKGRISSILESGCLGLGLVYRCGNDNGYCGCHMCGWNAQNDPCLQSFAVSQILKSHCAYMQNINDGEQ